MTSSENAIAAERARMPRLGLGTWQLSGLGATAAVETALALGYRHVDTAQMYGNEREVGEGLAAARLPREKLFVTSKLWLDSLTPAAVRKGTRQSLARLKLDYLDLLLIHWPNPEVPLGETLEALEAERTAGRIRALGVSNFPSALVEEAVTHHGAEILCDQVEYHPFLEQSKLKATLARHGILLTAYCPLARGEVAEAPPIRRAAEAHGRTAAEIALAWLLGQPGVAAIPKASSDRHLRENLAAQEIVLSAAERRAIDKLAGRRRLVDPAWAPAWDGPA